MIQTQTILKVADNSGAKIAKCIKTLKESKRNSATTGDIIVVSIKKAISKVTSKTKKIKKIKKGQVSLALIIRTKKKLNRKDGTSIKFDDNAVILINRANIPVGTRIFGPVVHELRNKRFMKVISLASSVI
jgi:large subunit ribosomal protein L14